MDFTIPRWLTRIFAAFAEWGNVRLIEGERLDICRVDILTALGGVGCVAWYGCYYGWIAGAAAAAIYAALAALPFVSTL